MSKLKRRITENGIDYILVGDYYIPDLKLPEEHRPIGKYGRMHREYLREVHPARFNTLILIGELWTWITVGNYISCRIVCGFIYEDKEYKAVSNYYVLTPFQRKEDLYANVFIEQNNPTKYSIELFQEGR